MSLVPIPPEDLVALDDFAAAHPLKIDLVYADPRHPENVFREDIYRADARLWAHKDFAPVILLAADICFERTGWLFEVKDCLRTVEAQQRMRETAVVKAHPQWLAGPDNLLSLPGGGGHPRGMAADIVLIDANGEKIDMGTKFDFFAEDIRDNPAARNATRFCDDEARNQRILYHRRVLEESMMEAAKDLGRALVPLPEEWWDFRFPSSHVNAYAPVRDADLPENMRMTAT